MHIRIDLPPAIGCAFDPPTDRWWAEFDFMSLEEVVRDLEDKLIELKEQFPKVFERKVNA